MLLANDATKILRMAQAPLWVVGEYTCTYAVMCNVLYRGRI
jgi:hypothetical protein